jgi:uncharacterized repeat protein (TIGR03803 family)
MQSRKPFSIAKATFLIFSAFLLVSAILPAQSQAQKFRVLHTFQGRDGIGPDSELPRDSAGNLYGTTAGGGANNCVNVGCGTAFKMDKNGKILWLHSFNGPDGDAPFGLLRSSAGSLYGTTGYGGKVNHSCGSVGCGVVFKLDNNGKETVLHKFNGADGSSPGGPLVEDSAGNLYGVTQYGSDGGTVFRLDKARKESALYSFGCGSDGCDPASGVILDAADNIYGTTFIGGDLSCNPEQGCGVVFKVDTGGNETVLHTFEASDGANPTAPLLFDSAGNLYGTTQNGGNLQCDGGLGCGVAFELSPNSNGTWTETVLYTFCSEANCADGMFPGVGKLVHDSSGNLFGTTRRGGGIGCGGEGCGVVFKLDADGTETVLYSFTGGRDGYQPLGGVTLCGGSNLCGTANSGGAHADGTVFRISP